MALSRSCNLAEYHTMMYILAAICDHMYHLVYKNKNININDFIILLKKIHTGFPGIWIWWILPDDRFCELGILIICPGVPDVSIPDRCV